MEFSEEIHQHGKELKKIQRHLNLVPHDWPQYQAQITVLFDAIFNLCVRREKELGENENEIYQTRRHFQEFIYPYLQMGEIGRMMLEKPFGYQGDFMLLDNLYYNQPRIIGFERAVDEYILNSPFAKALRDRKDAYRQYLKDFSDGSAQVSILNIACGPSREVREFFQDAHSGNAKIRIDCVDQDLHILDYAKELTSNVLTDHLSVRWIQENMMRFALSKEPSHSICGPYDMIYSVSILDNLDDKVALRLICKLKTCLRPGGLMVLSSFRKRSDNPSRHLMEWGGGWDVIYRSGEDFSRLFSQAGFVGQNFNIQSGGDKIIQFGFAAG